MTGDGVTPADAVTDGLEFFSSLPIAAAANEIKTILNSITVSDGKDGQTCKSKVNFSAF